MMNLLALFLVASSLMAASVWPQGHQITKDGDEDVIVKEGHRVIVVEYDEEGNHHKTKVSISPNQPHQGFVEEAKEKFKDAGSILPNLGMGISSEDARAHGGGVGNRPGELICDAFGKCKHKMAGVIGKAKEKANDATEKAAETVHDTMSGGGMGVAREAKDAVVDSAERMVETVVQKAKDAKASEKEFLGRAKWRAEDPKETATVGFHDVASNDSEIAHEAKRAAEKVKETVAQKAKDVKESSNESLNRGKEKARDTAEDVKEGAKQSLHGVKEGTRPDASAGKVFDGMRKMFSLEAWESPLNILRLMGFASAYGMGLWVTFISSYVLSRALPRQQFAVVQSKIYPVYFRAMGYGIGAALLGHILVHRKRLWTDKTNVFQGYNLLAALVMVLVNAKYLEPKATKLMFERLKIEKEESRGGGDSPSPTAEAAASVPLAPSQELVRTKLAALNEKLRKLNTYSSFLNVVCLMALSCHQVYLGHRLGTS